MLRKSDLKGFEIPGLPEKLIATLYADDTTVYLSQEDSYGTLLNILDTWCRAATAKFNVLKTEIIPLGTARFRRDLIATRRLNDLDIEIPHSVRIARDGEGTRILGTWPGNGVSITAWTPILDKLNSTLERWSASHPTHEGKSLLLQIYAGGYTQYLTAAQGMPKKIEERVAKAVLDFFWDGSKKHPINVDTLRKKKHAGGKALFDVKARNDAAYVVWLSRYLAPNHERPIWAFMAD
ncbi:hypothetical protein EXIGLDRAFT_816690, partial [Exidia glandulosa HHB12029]